MEASLQVLSRLALELLDLCLTVELDEYDSEDHSLIELAGEVLGATLDEEINIAER